MQTIQYINNIDISYIFHKCTFHTVTQVHSGNKKINSTKFQAKAAIRQIVPHGLKESISKVRSSVAYAVSAIAYWDWPEEWPELFGILMDALTSGNANAVHGAMRVLTGRS